MVRHDGEKTWRLAKLDTHLYLNDHIKSAEDSAAIISCEDMSTYVLKPESEVVLTEPPGKGTKLQILAGNLWINFKRMLKDGSMEVEMTQAVTAIKGTTFEVWETGGRNSSIISVEEGVVSVRNKTTGQTVDVSAGQIASATPAGFVNSWTLANTVRTNEQVLFNNGNDKQVFNGGKSQQFYLGKPTIVSYIMTYHWNEGRGAPSGTISLRSDTGLTFGPWQATLTNGGYWIVRPNTLVRPGMYEIIDSDPSTWSQETGAGIATIKGFKQ